MGENKTNKKHKDKIDIFQAEGGRGKPEDLAWGRERGREGSVSTSLRAVPREWCLATWSGKERCSERELRESLAAGDHPENWRAAFTRWRAAV